MCKIGSGQAVQSGKKNEQHSLNTVLRPQATASRNVDADKP